MSDSVPVGDEHGALHAWKCLEHGHGSLSRRRRALTPAVPRRWESNQQLGHAAHNVLPARSLNGPSKPLQAANSSVTGGCSDARANLTAPHAPGIWLSSTLRPSLHARGRRAARRPEGRPEPIACRGDRNENDARLSAPKGTDQPPYARCVEFDSDDDGSPEDYDSQYPPPQKWRADFYLAAPGQPPALTGATRPSGGRPTSA
jgi:hypothetical protein